MFLSSPHHTLPPIVIYLFPFLFVGMWALATFIISRMGWAALAANYRTDQPFEGKRVGRISASINLGNYKNSLVLWYNEQGMYLKPVFFFRLFHPPVLIPWSEIKEEKDFNILFSKWKELIIGSPRTARILIRKSTYDLMERNNPAF